MTIEELEGSPRGQKLVFVGDGNNVARSLAVASALLGADFVLCRARRATSSPPTSAPASRNDSPSSRSGRARSRSAVAGADVVYTDVWASMGQEHEADRRREAFAPYQVNEDLLAHWPAAT